MHGHDRAGARRHRALHGGGIDVECVGLNVHEHRRGAGIVNRAGRREEAERRRDDFVAWLQIQRLEGQQQRIGAARAADAVPGVGQPGDCRLEVRHGRPHDELLRLDDLHHRGEHVILDRVVLRDQVQHWDVHEAGTREGFIWRSEPADSWELAPHTAQVAPPPTGCSRSPHWHIHPTRRAGTPTISPYAGTSEVTTAPAPMKAYSPSVTPQTMVAFAPIEPPRFTSVRRYSFLRGTWLRGFITLVNTHDGPRNTSSSSSTPS